MDKRKNSVDNYLSIKRAFLLSLTITLAYYLLYMLTHFFGRPLFGEGNRMQGQDKKQAQTEIEANTDTLQLGKTVDMPVETGQQVLNRESPKKEKTFNWWTRMFISIPLTFILVFAVMLFNRKIMSIHFKKHSHELISNILGSFVIGLFLSAFGTLFQKAVLPFIPGPPRSIWHHLGFGWMSDFPLVSIALMSGYLLRSLYKEKIIAVENEVLRTENMVSRYEALKSQLDPHFLFNSMNTLKSLISVDSGKAEDYVQQLSTVLRYTLQKQEVVTLAEELKSTADYCRMLKIRYGDNLIFDHHIDHERYDNYLVLPLAIQGLVENVIKHNVISTRQPMRVHISTDEDNHLIVSNKIQPKIMKEEGSGIGLANLVERYRLQWDKNVEIFDDGKIFRVTLPLKENE